MARKPKANKPVVSRFDARYQAESDVRTLQNAEEIKADKGRMVAAKAMVKKQMTALNKIKGT